MIKFEKSLLKDYMDEEFGYRLSQFRRWPRWSLDTTYTPEFKSIFNSLSFLADETYD
jgi:hypothetical protein